MSPPARHRAPEPSNPDNESAVRECATTPPPPPPSAPTATQPASSGAPRERLEAKLRLARTVLGSLSASDDRARLL
ncbi:MAG TPA: hypothetical protein VGQ57_16240, partial [Polyangiaceae bacterium]|nr:hypothetical protein [Polyangiaceae bacterium]